MIGAYFKVANLVQYISRSVITGYITAAALLIITNQIPKSLGLEMLDKEATFYQSAVLMFQSIHTAHWATLIVSLSTALLFFFLNKKFKALPNVAICLVAISAATELILGHDSGIKFLSGINAADWSFQTPEFSLNSIQLLASPALAIALLCILEGISIGKSLAAKTGAVSMPTKRCSPLVWPTLLALFFRNARLRFANSLNTSITSGGRTVLASCISGVIIFLGAFALGPLTQYIPQCTLAVLVIAIGISLINKHAIRVVTFSTKSDAAVFGATFVSGLFMPLNTAIYVGVGTSIILFLKKVARPEMVEYTFNKEGQLAEMDKPEQRSVPQVSIVHVEGELFFGAADLFHDQMRRICEEPNLKIVVLKMRNAHNLDATGVMALEELLLYMGEKGRYLILSEVKADMIRVLKNSGIYEQIEERNIFTDEPSNPTMSTAKALKRAKDHLGDTQADVSIYVDRTRDKTKQGERP